MLKSSFCLTIALLNMFVVCLVTEQPACAQAADHTLWQIGTVDRDDKDFALAPSHWNQFTKDALFVVGTSSPAQDWPYVQPGPDDQWAGGRNHTNSIYFGLSQISKEGSCNLTLSFIDTQTPFNPTLDITVNGQLWTRQTVPGGGDASLNGQPGKGTQSSVSVDFPSSLLHPGINNVTVTSTQGSWLIYDAIVMTTPAGNVLTKLPPFAVVQSASWLRNVLVKKNGAYDQVLQLTMVNTGAAGKFDLFVAGEGNRTIDVPTGKSSTELYYPESSGSQSTAISLHVPGQGEKAIVYADRTPCRRYTIYEIEQSHMDIGYAYLQQKTLDIHTQDITDAFAMFPKTKSYPSDDRFRWNCESLIETDAWLKKASPAQIAEFEHAVRNGDLGLAALYCNELTGLCRPEELAALLADANTLRTKYNIPIDSAMITDVPGYTWGIVPMLADSGIKYFSWGPNPGDHMGTSRDFDNQAFYWASPSGKEKVLVWQSNNGYQPAFNDDDQSVKDYMASFDKRFPNDPYDLICDRHTVNDNGPTDPALPAFVRDWNQKYAYPHMIIATNSRMFHDFEARYGKTLTQVHGDFTGYWEDGAVSTAAETAINRNSAELAAQDDILSSITDPAAYPHNLFDDAWKNAVLYDEHTWGAYDSWTNPESAFDTVQWTWKQKYALNTQADTKRLLAQSSEIVSGSKAADAIAVFNTSNWVRTELVTLSAAQSKAGDIIKDESGKIVPSQRLSDGTLAFVAANVPGFSSIKYRVFQGKSTYHGHTGASSTMMYMRRDTLSDFETGGSDKAILLRFDPSTGGISSWLAGIVSRILLRGEPHVIVSANHPTYSRSADLVNAQDPTCRGLNDYLYVLGDDNNEVSYASGAKITVLDSGPLVASVKVDSAAPGCASLSRIYRVVDGFDKVWVTDTLDKQQVHQNEGVHIGFNFNVPDGVVRLDEPWSVVRPDVDQTQHANKSVFPVERWCDVSNDQYGVTCANLDTPMMEIGGITQPRENNGGWLDTTKPGSTIYWQVMNNYWHTNYKAYQSGKVTFRYIFAAHGQFDQAAAQRFGIEQSQPFIVIPTVSSAKDYKLPLSISNDSVEVTACHPLANNKDWIIRLYNGSAEKQTVKIAWNGSPALKLEKTDLWANPGEKTSPNITMVPMEIITLRLTP
jgi:hypothetical protein